MIYEMDIHDICMIQQGPKCSTENYIQYPMINHKGKEYEKE